jgi:hypothetical protein
MSKPVTRTLAVERIVKHSVRYKDEEGGPLNMGTLYIPNGVLASLAGTKMIPDRLRITVEDAS